MTQSPPSTVEEAEDAWTAAMASSSVEAMAALLHPEAVVVHSPVGRSDGREEFLADAAGRPRSVEVTQVQRTFRRFGDTVIVCGIQQMDVPFVPGLPPFPIQAAVTRVWVQADGSWLLAHMQMARRITPG